MQWLKSEITGSGEFWLKNVCFLFCDKLPACWLRLLLAWRQAACLLAPPAPWSPASPLPWRHVARLLGPPVARSPAAPGGMPLRLLRYRITPPASGLARVKRSARSRWQGLAGSCQAYFFHSHFGCHLEKARPVHAACEQHGRGSFQVLCPCPRHHLWS